MEKNINKQKRNLVILFGIIISLFIISLSSALPVIYNAYTGKLDYYGLFNMTCSLGEGIIGINVSGIPICGITTASANFTNVAYTNRSENWGTNNITANNFFGNINWSYILNIPSYVIDYIDYINSLNNSIIGLDSNKMNKSEFNVTNSTYLTNYSNITWNSLKGFPIACPAGTYVTQINNSITCTSVVETNWESNSSNVARTGDCPAGQVVQNTTNGGVECVTFTDGLSLHLNKDNWLLGSDWLTYSNPTLDFNSSKLSTYAQYQFANNNFNGSGNFNTTKNIKANNITYTTKVVSADGKFGIWSNSTDTIYGNITGL